MTIAVKYLTKFYKAYQKEPGFVGSVKSLLSRKYETIKAIEDVSFQIDEGELIGFIGPNGAGKTTTLKTLSGLLYPTKGEVSVLGYNPFERKKEFLKQISLVMGQKNQLWWDLPPLDSFLLNKEIYEIPDKKFNTILNELADLMDIGAILKVQVRKLSLGQRMKCELVAALLHSPKVLFLDEPTIGLDVVMQLKLREFIKEYNEKYNATVLLTSHYMGDVQALCKRIIIINHGKILFDGLLTDLIKEYAPFKIIRFISEKNIDRKLLGEFGVVKNLDYPVVSLSVPGDRVNASVGKLLKMFSIDDLTIEDPDIEDIIRDVFSKVE